MIPMCPVCCTTNSVHHTTRTMMPHKRLIDGTLRDCTGSGQKCAAKNLGATREEMQARLDKWRRSLRSTTR